jgi:hypothetical protein
MWHPARISLLSLVAVATLAQGALPISTDGSNPAGWNARDAAPLAAGDNHRPIYEDDNIRILSVTVRAGTAETYHDHPYYSVLVFDSTARVVDRDRDGRSLGLTVFDALDAPSGAPFVAVQAPEALHSIRNDDTHDVHLTRIEFKRGMNAPRIIPPFWGKGPMPVSTDGTDPARWDPKEEALAAAAANHRVIFENDAIRVLSVVDPPRDEEPLHRHRYPSVLVFDRVSDTVLRGPDDRPLPSDVGTAHVPTIMVLPPQAMHRVSNPDTKLEHLTRIEFKQGFPR